MAKAVTGRTRLAAVIGQPVDNSLSPTMHNAAYAAMGLDIAYLALPVVADELDNAVAGIRALGFVGASVTVPYKQAVIPFLDELSPGAEQLQAVNCIVNSKGRLVGHNTDGAGFIASLSEVDFDPRQRKCVVVGAGGAARAIIAALAGAGASEVRVVNRSQESARMAALLAGDSGSVAGPDSISDADLVVNATSIGMTGTESESEVPFATDLLGPGHVVVDIVYSPPVTLLLHASTERGARTANGLGMLVHQAVEQIRLWTGRDAPTLVMKEAALRA